MHAFARVNGGFESLLEADERRLLAQVVADVALVVIGPDGPDASEDTDPTDDGGLAFDGGFTLDDTEPADDPWSDVGPWAHGEPELGPEADAAARGDAHILAALDFDPAQEARWAAFDDPALERLVPLSSRGDAEAAEEFRRLTQRDLRDEKAGRLMVVEQELRTPSGEYAAVRVDGADVGLWLAALTDLRLVLAARLGLEDDEDAARIHALAEGDEVPQRDLPPGVQDEDTERLMAGLYTAMSWWQESLLQSMEA